MLIRSSAACCWACSWPSAPPTMAKTSMPSPIAPLSRITLASSATSRTPPTTGCAPRVRRRLTTSSARTTTPSWSSSRTASSGRSGSGSSPTPNKQPTFALLLNV
uniref:IP17595p n=3 Tax=Drosophila melanogaster TaxID=7227 RepID=A2VEH5_DROME|nr:IP17595p [Drosophila melanogaster]